MFGLLIRAPIAGDGRDLADDQSFYIRTGGLAIRLVGAIVADLRIGEDDDLAAIGRIGENFLIAGDGGVEDHLACALDRRTKTGALEDRSIFQDENRLLQISDSYKVGALQECAADQRADHFIGPRFGIGSNESEWLAWRGWVVFAERTEFWRGRPADFAERTGGGGEEMAHFAKQSGGCGPGLLGRGCGTNRFCGMGRAHFAERTEARVRDAHFAKRSGVGQHVSAAKRTQLGL